MEAFDALYRAILDDPGRLPMTWKLGDTAYSGFPEPDFAAIETKITRAEGRENARVALRGPGGLRAAIVLGYYPAFGALEWTVWFENAGETDTPVISDVWDARVDFEGEKPALRGILGDHANDYRPYEYDLTRENVRFFSDLGRPTHIFFPYFHFACGDGGCLIALGWGGTWEAKFDFVGGATRFSGRGTNGLCTYLKPGEQIRTALMAFLPYEGLDDDGAMNLWRRWYIECNMPRVEGKTLEPISTTGFMGDTGLPNSDGSISERYFTWKPSFEKMLSEGVRMDYRWFDAGWYVDPYGKTVPSDWWGTVGTWVMDEEKWPGDSFKESTDFARAHQMKTLMWFEPERVTHVDALIENYGYKREWALGDPDGAACGNDIGQKECLDWTCERILTALEKGGVEMYREDNNFDSRPCWAARDVLQGPNRAGITENKAVVGHYELWDRIVAFCETHGGNAFVDSCSSGGGRNDLESMRRGVPLLRSDADRTTTALRLSMTTSFDRWIPFCGASCTEQVGQLDPDGKRDAYIFRASYLPVLNLSAQWTQDPNTDFDLIRRGMDEWRTVTPYLLKDFYVLTPWHDQTDKKGWTAFAYWDKDKQAGVLQAFRMEEAEDKYATVDIKWLDPDAKYRVTNADTGAQSVFTGRAMRKWTVSLPRKRMAALQKIERA